MPSSHATSLAYLATYVAAAEQLQQPVIALLAIVLAFFLVSSGQEHADTAYSRRKGLQDNGRLCFCRYH